jgi:uncharacterized SAM-binding protein YcdF (DUF218 family)
MQNAWRPLCRFVGTMGLAALCLATLTPVSRWLYQAMLIAPGQGNADAIVVLGASVSEDGVLDGSSLRRALAGVLALRQGRAPTLLLLGCPRGVAVEAQVRADLARSLGVAPDAILTEARALTTRQEARRVAELLLPRGQRRVLLVTGECHMWRARALFERAGLEVLPCPVRELPLVATAPAERLTLLWQVARESAARAMYRVLGRV